ncbi:hypothetical protein HK097_004919, partial [Rhizophlyctis rosea]
MSALAQPYTLSAEVLNSAITKHVSANEREHHRHWVLLSSWAANPASANIFWEDNAASLKGSQVVRYRLDNGTLHSHKGIVDLVSDGITSREHVKQYLAAGHWGPVNPRFEVYRIKDVRFKKLRGGNFTIAELLLIWEPTSVRVMDVDCVIRWLPTWVKAADYCAN